MNIYQKINEARLKFQQAGVKMSGKNKGKEGKLIFSYYTLEDIVPMLTQICKEVGLCNLTTFTQTEAVMTVVDTEKPEDVLLFTSPMSTANLPNCHPVQNIGAVETYERRYLYQLAYDIVEADVLDATLDTQKPQVGANGIQLQKGPETPGDVDKRLRDLAWDLLQKSTMPAETKEKWIKSFPKLSDKTISGLLDRFQAEGVHL